MKALRLNAITAIITTAIATSVTIGSGISCVCSVATTLGVNTSVGSVEYRARSV